MLFPTRPLSPIAFTVGGLLSVIHASSSIECTADTADNVSCTSNSPPTTTPEDILFQKSLNAWNGTLIDHIPYTEMSDRRFYTEYQTKRKPVVITGMYANSPLTEGVNEGEWGWQAMRDRFGDVVLENRVTSNVSRKGCTGTGLCEGKPIKLKDLFDQYFLNKNDDSSGKNGTTSESPYPHDIELKKFLPEMFEVYEKPSIFAENLLLPTKAGKDRWPSLFFGAQGTQTNLHTDSMGTTFTMAVFRGRKQFVLFEPKDGPKLCMERPTPGLNYGVGMDPFDPDFTHCPEAKRAHALFADIQAGDILFMPGHTHHAARNLSPSVGISQNLLTTADYNAIMEDFAGYVAKLKRKKGEQPSVGLDFLSVRDLYKLLFETKFQSNWRNDKPFWNADDATKESYKRIKYHMTKVLEKDAAKYSTRLAYFCNYEFLILALKAFGAWDCLNEKGKKQLLAKAPVDSHANKGEHKENMLDVVGDIFKKYSIGNMVCAPKFDNFMNDVMNVQIQGAVSTLEREKGLTKYCCG